MNVEIGAEAAQFPKKEYINGLPLQCTTGYYQPCTAQYWFVILAPTPRNNLTTAQLTEYKYLGQLVVGLLQCAHPTVLHI